MIYFIQCGENGPIKIGQTGNGVEERLGQLQTGCPYGLRVLWVYNGSDWTEETVHKKFSHERIRGEWFRPSSTLIDFITNEMMNVYEIETPNGRFVEFSESFDLSDSIDIKTSKMSDFSNRCAWTHIFHNYKTSDVGIDAASIYSNVNVLNGKIIDGLEW